MICFLYRFISKRCELVSNQVPHLYRWRSTDYCFGNGLGTGVDE